MVTECCRDESPFGTHFTDRDCHRFWLDLSTLRCLAGPAETGMSLGLRNHLPMKKVVLRIDRGG